MSFCRQHLNTEVDRVSGAEQPRSRAQLCDLGQVT